MVTLSVYFEYKEVLCKIFTKYIVAILQVNPNYFIILHKIITNDIYYYYYVILFIIIKYY